MENTSSSLSDKKQILVDQIKKIQLKIDAIENQRVAKVVRLAKKFKLLDLSDEILEKEFSLVKDKYGFTQHKETEQDRVKKNLSARKLI